MTKQLTPLEAFYKIANIHQYAFQEVYKEETNLIEDALKDYEELQKDYCEVVEKYGEWREKNKKKLNALEFFKNNCEFDFIKTGINGETKFEIHIRPKDKKQFLFTCLSIYPKTQEEFDLLKEVLL